jgi:hypothetical protein
MNRGPKMTINQPNPNHLSVDSLKQEAQRAARLQDWGDREFEPPLLKFIDCFNEVHSGGDTKTAEMMRFHFKNAQRSILVNRLHIQDNFNKQPEILKTPVRRPLFIIGMARTGSTLLHRLISQDPDCRHLQYWEMNHPFYSHNIGLNHEARSIKLSELKINEIYMRLPELHHIHEIKATAPEECNILMRHSFCSLYLASEWNLPRYAQWLVEHDMTDSYRYYRKVLQLLLHHKPGRFTVLKCPSHLLNLAAILKVFPDANFLWIHRDPLKSFPSYLNLLSVFWGNKPNDKQFIDFIFNYSLRAVETGMKVEKTIPSRQLMHLSYKELMKDPAAGIRNIYDTFDYPVTTGMDTKIKDWLKENARHKHGVHKYSPEKFGLNETLIREKFNRYYDHFGHLL